MSSNKLTWIGALVLAVAFGFLAEKSLKPDTQTISIHSYTVPPSRAEEIKNALNRMFSSEKGDASAQVFGNGNLVVKGPESYQTGISKLLKDMSEKTPSIHSIRFDYWLVRGESAAQSNAAEITPLAPVLATINQAQGAKKFTVLDHIGLQSLDRREVDVRGALAQVKNVAKTSESGIEIWSEIRARDLGELKIDTQVKSGEFVILGENGLQSQSNDGRLKEVYHIIRAEVVQ